MAVLSGVMMAHAGVLTEATTSAGWIGWMAAKITPASIDATPVQRMTFAPVILGAWLCSVTPAVWRLVGGLFICVSPSVGACFALILSLVAVVATVFLFPGRIRRLCWPYAAFA